MLHCLLLEAATIVLVAASGDTVYPLAQIEVQLFVNSIVDDAVKTMDQEALSTIQSDGSRLLDSTLRTSPRCEACQTVNMQRLNAYFQHKIVQGCNCAINITTSPQVKNFCRTFKDKISNHDEELNGYLFQRLRVLQLAISMCIGSEDCSPVDPFNAFLNPVLPDILTDVERYCPTVSFGSYQECVDTSSQDILAFAMNRVQALCAAAKGRSRDLDEFCSYFSSSEEFGRGLIQGMVPSYQYVTFLCKQYTDQCQCSLAGGVPSETE
ncbi:hypothetical protein FOL46_003285 [Perkinsus olseni]|nr:hypothetical protein FOL46_003285 [Perkinsus olseni]